MFPFGSLVLQKEISSVHSSTYYILCLVFVSLWIWKGGTSGRVSKEQQNSTCVRWRIYSIYCIHRLCICVYFLYHLLYVVQYSLIWHWNDLIHQADTFLFIGCTICYILPTIISQPLLYNFLNNLWLHLNILTTSGCYFTSINILGKITVQLLIEVLVWTVSILLWS